jgi:hypothetical protein
MINFLNSDFIESDGINYGRGILAILLPNNGLVLTLSARWSFSMCPAYSTVVAPAFSFRMKGAVKAAQACR